MYGKIERPGFYPALDLNFSNWKISIAHDTIHKNHFRKHKSFKKKMQKNSLIATVSNLLGQFGYIS
jgi:hypothetical protein